MDGCSTPPALLVTRSKGSNKQDFPAAISPSLRNRTHRDLNDVVLFGRHSYQRPRRSDSCDRALQYHHGR